MSLEPFAVDWRALFNELNIAWIDKGRNTSKNNVNVNCPFCGDDNGFHMRISEDYAVFNCWRGTGHGGTSFVYLLHQLGCTRPEAIRLLNEYRQRRTLARAPAPLVDLSPQWNRFLPLSELTPAHPVFAHLASRGFADPHKTAARFDLRYARAGTWAMRLLLPLVYDGRLQTWTGRSVLPHIEPRYLVEKITDPSQLYIPSPPRGTLYVVEGPMDALKIASAMQGTDVSAVALCSKDLNASKILRIQDFRCQNVFLMLDNDAPTLQAIQLERALAAALRGVYVARRKLPRTYKDAGQVPEQELTRLLR